MYDEGLAVVGATRVLAGEIPYRDFWTLYGPGQYYLLAAAFRLFGPSLLVERLLSVVILGLVAAALYLLARRIVSPALGFLVWLVWVARTGDVRGFFGSPVPTALLLSLGAVLCLVASFRHPKRHWLAAGGLCAGSCALVRHDLGFYTVVAGMGVAAAFVWVTASDRRRSTLIRRTATSVGIYGGLAAIIAIPVYAYFAWRAGPWELVDQLIIFPLTVFPRVRALPPPPPWPDVLMALPFYFPFVVLAVAVIAVAARTFRRREVDWGVLLVTVVGVLYLSQAVARSDIAHVFPALSIAVLELAVLVEWSPSRSGPRAVACGMAIALAAGVAYRPLASKGSLAADALAGAPMASLDLDRARGIMLTPSAAASYGDAIRYVRARTTPAERIFVGSSRHDRIIANDAMFYFLAERSSATRYHDLHPGLVTERPVQDVIVGEIERADVRYVVLLDDRRPDAIAGSETLDRAIRERFQPLARFGPRVIWVRHP